MPHGFIAPRLLAEQSCFRSASFWDISSSQDGARQTSVPQVTTWLLVLPSQLEPSVCGTLLAAPNGGPSQWSCTHSLAARCLSCFLFRSCVQYSGSACEARGFMSPNKSLERTREG